MDKSQVWFILYILSYIAHWSWIPPAMGLMSKFITKGFLKQLGIIFAVWLLVGVLCSGCPFTYLHQYIELQMGWRKAITYQYQDSIAYRYIIDPARRSMIIIEK